MRDGSDAIADWPLLNALVNTAAGASWVSIHHGGGTGIGYSQHAGMVVVADGTPLAAQKLERVLTTDPGMGVIRHADAGYERAIEVAHERGVHIPMDGLSGPSGQSRRCTAGRYPPRHGGEESRDLDPCRRCTGVRSLPAAFAAPATSDYTIVHTYPHNTNAWTEGLYFWKDNFYESTGLTGKSSLRRVSLTTGAVLQKQMLPSTYSGRAWP